MSAAYNILRSRLDEVIDETTKVLNDEVRAGNITSDAVVDKVQHLINVAKKYAASADNQSGASAYSDTTDQPVEAGVSVDIGPQTTIVHVPDTFAVEVNPPVGFVRLSFGLVNLLQVALLDVPAKQMYLVGGVMRSLSMEDTIKLVHWTKLYQLR